MGNKWKWQQYTKMFFLIFFGYIDRTTCIEGSNVLTTQQMEQWWCKSQDKRSLSFRVLL